MSGGAGLPVALQTSRDRAARSLPPRYTPLTCGYVRPGLFLGFPSSAMRPWALNFGTEKSTDKRRKSTDENGGSGYADRCALLLALTCCFESLTVFSLASCQLRKSALTSH
jgi:hypothetical protein